MISVREMSAKVGLTPTNVRRKLVELEAYPSEYICNEENRGGRVPMYKDEVLEKLSDLVSVRSEEVSGLTVKEIAETVGRTTTVVRGYLKGLKATPIGRVRKVGYGGGADVYDFSVVEDVKRFMVLPNKKELMEDD